MGGRWERQGEWEEKEGEKGSGRGGKLLEFWLPKGEEGGEEEEEHRGKG